MWYKSSHRYPTKPLQLLASKQLTVIHVDKANR